MVHGDRTDHWAFTLHDYDSFDLAYLYGLCEEGNRISQRCRVKYILMGYERCPTTSRRHVQGYLQLDAKVPLDTLRGGIILPSGSNIHYSMCRGSDQDNYDYCTKDGDFSENGERKSIPRKPGQGNRTDWERILEAIRTGTSYESLVEEVPETCARYDRFIKERIYFTRQEGEMARLKADMEGAVLRPWQEEIWQILSQPHPDPRQIIWVWESQGNAGKTWFARYLSVVRTTLVLEPGKRADLAHIFVTQKSFPQIVVLDLNRTIAPGEDGKETGQMNVIYSFMENLKNGYMISTKYNSTTYRFPIPHVLVLANFEPDQSKMSSDRWFIKNI
jgi:hypothetical protein